MSKDREKKLFNKIPFLYVIIVSILVIISLFVYGLYSYGNLSQNSSDNSDYSAVNSKAESCLQCHQQTTGFSIFHDPKVIGCTPCHLGNGTAVAKEDAHKNMVKIPGNLSNAKETCGICHPSELHKINHSLMTTNSGIVAVDKFIFGEANSPNIQYHIKDLKNSASDTHLKNLCAKCHLGAEKKEFGSITTQSRGGGCNACHLNYTPSAKSELEIYTLNKDKLPTIHPSSDINVTNNHCFGCHSRSSRIATNYIGWQETLKDTILASEINKFTTLDDGRIYKIKTEDVHHTKGLLCIDCHSSHEVMGDGKDYLHEEDAVKIQCVDCHFKTKPNTIPFDSLDVESNLVYMLRQYKHADKRILVTKKDANPLVNTFMNNIGEAFLMGKGDKKLHPIKRQSEICSRDKAHQDLSCNMCHASWTSRCIGCHNQFDKDDKNGYDLLSDKKTIGQWREYVSEFGASPPTMGVRVKGNSKKIEPAIPGMIMSIDHSSFTDNTSDSTSFHRLYAPNAPHTIGKKARSCTSCHTNPMAIGYGKGTLTFNKKNANWTFRAFYDANVYDGLPEDAWMPFLKRLDNSKNYSTRTNFRPLNLQEQKTILTIGTCLQCHKSTSKVMQNALKDGLANQLKNLSNKCIIPKFN